jgi:hypothetical protein
MITGVHIRASSPEGQKTDSHRAEIEAGSTPDKIGYQE